MTSHTTKRFREALRVLPARVQEQARAAYRLFRQDPYHSSLQFKQVHSVRPLYSVRIGGHYRALGIRDGDDVVWFWIGSHADYDRILANV